jgi:GNAT superfamily N-acetyltransferase
LDIPDAQSNTLNVGMTGVLRAHRRMGIATALKVRAIQFAQTYGARWIETGNEENNPMLQINLRLGFQPAPAWLSFENRI